MELIQLNLKKKLNQPTAVALGYFDGIHLGHQAVIKEVVNYANTHQMRSAVMTFSPNPNLFLNKLTNESLLTPYQEKVRLLKELGVDELIILPFNEELANMRAVDFIKRYLIDSKIEHVSTGFDFRFGRLGEGEVELLKQYPQQFSLNVTPKYELEQEKIGATEIKQYLAQGNLLKVRQMLGRPYRIRGVVISGKQLGRTIGFPTANLKLDEDYVMPKRGVYAVKVTVLGKEYIGMCNIGHNPTFNFNQQISIETYLFDFDQDIYGESMMIDFYHYLREEKCFNSVEELTAQLTQDREAVRTYFK